MKDNFLLKEDYEEPTCPLCEPSDVKPIAVGRMIEKLDEYLGRGDYSSAERHLKYWQAEAELGNDLRGKLTVENELIGLYRKCGNQTEGLAAIDTALSLLRLLGLEQTISAGTTFINAATGYKAFGKPDLALPLYEKARALYEANLDANDPRRGGLYNNMALTLAALGSYDEAEELYGKALAVMSQVECGEAELAITYCNLADLEAARSGTLDGEEKINEYLTKAAELLDADCLPHDGYHAFVCEKCAPTFGYYGHFMTELKLKTRAKEIYERS